MVINFRAEGIFMRYLSKENLSLVLILFVVFSRLIPHPPNFTPVFSIALFSGFIFKSKWKSFLIPVVGLVLSNLFLGFQLISWVVVGIVLGITVLGTRLQSKKPHLRWIPYSMKSSILFFVLSNFFVWFKGSFYPLTFEGLLTCYTMAIPFFKNTILSTLIYSFILFEGGRLIEFCLNKFANHRLQEVV